MTGQKHKLLPKKYVLGGKEKACYCILDLMEAFELGI
jgi:hypothetical protein